MRMPQSSMGSRPKISRSLGNGVPWRGDKASRKLFEAEVAPTDMRSIVNHKSTIECT